MANSAPSPAGNRPVPTWKAWLQAARLPSQMYIFWPLLLGQALAMGEGFSWEVVLVCHFYGLVSQLYIVFANDVADMATDRRNFTKPATIPIIQKIMSPSLREQNTSLHLSALIP